MEMTLERPADHRVLDEEVVRWRCECLRAAGYEEFSVIALAEAAHVDLHLAVGLLRRGCPADVACSILL